MARKPLSSLDEQRYKVALQKLLRGEPLNDREQNLVKRYEAEKDERERWRHYETVPSAHMTELTGLQRNQLRGLAALLRVPAGDDQVNLRLVLPQIFRLARAAKKREEEENQNSAKQRLAEEKATLARLDRLHTEGQLVPVPIIEESLHEIAVAVRRFGETIQRQHGPEVLETFLECWSDVETKINAVCDRFTEK